MLFGFFFRRKIINSNYLAVTSLHAASVTDVPGSRIVAQNELLPPAFAIVAADSCTDSLGLPTIAVGRAHTSIAVGGAQSSISQPYQTGGISVALSRISNLAQEFPRPAIVG